VPDHVLTDAGLTDVDAELEQFAVNVRRSPEWIFAAEHTDQLANLFRYRRAATLAMANLPTPEKAKALPVPADHRGGLDDGNAGFPAVPDRGEPCPEKAVGGAQLRALDRTLEHAELMTQGQDLQLEGRPAPK